MSSPTLPATLTAAAAQACVVMILSAANSSYSSNARVVPYAERYRDATGIMETPAEYLQRASEDEERRGGRL